MRYENNIDTLTLEVTENCNLQCHYCPWEYLREGNRKSMSLQTAISAIDFMKNHSSSAGECSLGFYGGEPLIEFNIIKKCAEYARKKFVEKGIRIHFTTNATLVDEQKAKYLAENDFNILVSIDGPKHIHDKHRIDRQNKGSYDRSIKGLKILLNAYKNKLNCLGINAVVTPPYNLNVIKELWKENPWIPKDIRLSVDFVSTAWTDFIQRYASNDIHNPTNDYKNQMKIFKTNVVHWNPEKSSVANSLFESAILRIYKRPIWKAPRKWYHLNGCCFPGLRKLYVGCDGKFYMCERAHGAPPIGSVSTGYDKQAIQNLIKTYAEESIIDCKNCWAVALCSICFARAYFDRKFLLEQKRKACNSARKNLKERLVLYCSILEENQHALDYMKSMEFA